MQVKTSRTFLRDCTVISPLALLLFGGQLSIAHAGGYVSVDHFRVRSTSYTRTHGVIWFTPRDILRPKFEKHKSPLLVCRRLRPCIVTASNQVHMKHQLAGLCQCGAVCAGPDPSAGRCPREALAGCARMPGLCTQGAELGFQIAGEKTADG